MDDYDCYIVGYYILSTMHNVVAVFLVTIVYALVWVAIYRRQKYMNILNRQRKEIEKEFDVSRDFCCLCKVAFIAQSRIALMLAVNGVLHLAYLLPWLMSLLQVKR